MISAASGFTRRRVLALGGLAASAGLVGCAAEADLAGTRPVDPRSEAVARVEAVRRRRGARIVSAAVDARPTELDLAGRTVATWAYGATVPGALLRATAGDVLRVTMRNDLPEATTVHWHGVALRNDMDGIPSVTQEPIRPGSSFTYEFAAARPGTYWFHPHVGTALDRGLYAPLIIDDPEDRGRYDAEFALVLDDWLDGTGRTPDDVYAALRRQGGGRHSMMGHGAGGLGGDVEYPYFLINGRPPADPQVLRARPGQRVRLRVINAGADTAFRLAVGGHRLRITHSDGFPVEPIEADAVLIGMGERYDVELTTGDGVFPVVALAEGKGAAAVAVLRTAGGRVPDSSTRPPELAGRLVTVAELRAAEAVRLPARSPDRTVNLFLEGGMHGYDWGITWSAGRGTHRGDEAIGLREGETVRLRFANRTMMFHPMHLHGHTFAVRSAAGAPRKDTVIVRPMETVAVDFTADNPGQWMTHCHNVYHAEAGMMAHLSYREG